MIAMLDSSYNRPTQQQAADAYSAGVRFWGVYVATQANVGLAAPWTQADVQVVQAVGIDVIAFLSGNDDPVAAAALARSWHALPMLDDENGIRARGSWEQRWIDDAGCGLYGGREAQDSVDAPYRIIADYPGYDPMAAWPTTPPSVPFGWQWQGTHTEFGLSVDRSWLDDSFGGAMSTSFPMRDEAEAFVDFLYTAVLHRHAATPDDREHWASIAMTQGLWPMVDQFVTNQDVEANTAVINQLIADYKAGKLGGSTESILVPHDHTTPAGTTGPATAR
jgi:hypothetical protein